MKKLRVNFWAVLVFIIPAICIPDAMAVDRVSLRSEARQLSDTDVKSMLVKYNFFDRTKNPDGAFANDFLDNGNGTVTDRITGLMWQKDAPDDGMIWQHAKEYVQKLNSVRFAGYADWRLPTIEELASLMKSGRANDLYIHPIFSAKQAFFWSTDTFGSDTAWYANFKGGIIQHIYDFFFYVKAVRSLR